MIGGPGGEGLPQRPLGQVLEAQHPHVVVGTDAPSYAHQVTPVGGHGGRRRLGGTQSEQPALDQLGEARVARQAGPAGDHDHPP